ncbi:hypothetical protein ACFWAP_00850 [Streptomyces goshikiensis]|uniref:hypothetical protein n=1 Tax=Streptomyces goshikiensis TaxID=1942 RepID=UPI00364E30CA
MENVRYRVGVSFSCVKRPMLSDAGDWGPECGAEIVMHKFWWCAQVCPKCLANYFCGGQDKNFMHLDRAGFYPADVAARVRAGIAANGGQHVPSFG